ncbi:MAG: bile acid:sodium symporter family protein [Sphingomonadaceae bacterium]
MAGAAKKWLFWDPFIAFLMATVVLATLVPVRGTAAAMVAGVANVGIALLFFLHGARLSREAIIDGAGNWRLHALVLASTYILFPALGLASAFALKGWIEPALLPGILFLTLLPSTVQSSIAFTSIARGNVAAAVCSASLSNLFGIVVTPLLVTLLLHIDGSNAGSSWPAIRTIGLQLLVPFALGHALRPLIGGFVARHKAILQPVDRGSILLVVYSAFSAAVIGGIWSQVGAADLLILLVTSAVILTVMLGATRILAQRLPLPRADATVLLFCGSKKSLVSGVPMAATLFAPSQVGLIVLPLMIFHQLQLLVCAVLAARLQRQGDALESFDQRHNITGA